MKIHGEGLGGSEITSESRACSPWGGQIAMFSMNQKRAIAEAVQQILRNTGHPELPSGEIQFSLHVEGVEPWSWADIRNNGAVTEPGVNPWNEAQDLKGRR